MLMFRKCNHGGEVFLSAEHINEIYPMPEQGGKQTCMIWCYGRSHHVFSEADDAAQEVHGARWNLRHGT